jgi:hypothetical protein
MSDEVNAPVTRAELREELKNHPTRAELKAELDPIRDALKQHDLRFDAMMATMGEMFAAIGQQIAAIGQRLVGMEQRMVGTEQRMGAMEKGMGAMEQRIGQQMVAMEQRLTDELRRHTSSSADASRSELAVVDDKYKDLPERVTKLEAKVFAKPRGRRGQG